MRLSRHMLLGLALLTLPASAEAQGSPMRDLAKKHYELGSKYYETSNFKEALVHFEKAYKLKAVPGLLFNMARCHEVMGNVVQAISHYERYLEEVPGAPRRAIVEARLLNLRARKAELEKKKAPKPAPVKPEPAPVKPEPASAPVKPEPEPAAPARPRSWRFWAGLGAAGLGGASLVTGVVLGGMARGKAGEYDEVATASKTPHYGTLEDLRSEGEGLEAGQIATLVVGGVLVAAGIGLVVWDRMAAGGAEEPGVAVTLVPAAGPRGGGLACQVRF